MDTDLLRAMLEMDKIVAAVERVETREQFLRALEGPAVLKPLSPTGVEKVFYLRRRQVKNLNQIITAAVETQARALLRRYGVVFPNAS